MRSLVNYIYEESQPIWKTKQYKEYEEKFREINDKYDHEMPSREQNQKNDAEWKAAIEELNKQYPEIAAYHAIGKTQYKDCSRSWLTWWEEKFSNEYKKEAEQFPPEYYAELRELDDEYDHEYGKDNAKFDAEWKAKREELRKKYMKK